MDYQKLLDTTEEILILRGSAGSGNYGHDGRKGKLGGSSKGGGLRRIGAKKDTPPGKRKEAAKKFREKRKEKQKARRKSSTDKSILALRNNTKTLADIGWDAQNILANLSKRKVEKLTGKATGEELKMVNKLTKNKLATYDGETLRLTSKGKELGKGLSAARTQSTNIDRLAKNLSGPKRASDDFFRIDIDGYKELLDHEKHILALRGIGIGSVARGQKRIDDTKSGYLTEDQLKDVAKRIDTSFKNSAFRKSPDAKDILSRKSNFKGLVQIANQKEIDTLLRDWETIRPKDARSAQYIATGVLGDGRAVELKSLIDLTGKVIKSRKDTNGQKIR